MRSGVREHRCCISTTTLAVGPGWLSACGVRSDPAARVNACCRGITGVVASATDAVCIGAGAGARLCLHRMGSDGEKNVRVRIGRLRTHRTMRSTRAWPSKKARPIAVPGTGVPCGLTISRHGISALYSCSAAPPWSRQRVRVYPPMGGDQGTTFAVWPVTSPCRGASSSSANASMCARVASTAGLE
jgi:hypothetical protein